MLSRQSRQLIDQLAEAELLSRVGLGCPLTNVTVCPDWKTALKQVLSKAWYNGRVHWRNELTSALSRDHRKTYRNWNRIADAARPLMDEIVSPAIDRLDQRLGARKLARDLLHISVRVDLVSIVQEIEYDAHVASHRYRTLLPIYLSGHLACGWDTSLTSGRPVVY